MAGDEGKVGRAKGELLITFRLSLLSGSDGIAGRGVGASGENGCNGR